MENHSSTTTYDDDKECQIRSSSSLTNADINTSLEKQDIATTTTSSTKQQQQQQQQQQQSSSLPIIALKGSRSSNSTSDSSTMSNEFDDFSDEDLLDDVIQTIKSHELSKNNNKQHAMNNKQQHQVQDNNNNDHHIPIAFETDINHHSLPDIDEKQYNKRTWDKKFGYLCSNRRRKFGLLISSIILLVMIVVTSTTVHNNNNKGESNNNMVSNNNNNNDTYTVPEEPPYVVPPPTLPSMTYDHEIFQSIVYMLSIRQKISLTIDFETLHTPQYKAAMYFAQYYHTYQHNNTSNNDLSLFLKFNNNINSNEFIQFVQQYIMIVFYYSLNGLNWYNQLSFLTLNISICEWNEYIPSTNTTMGIICSKDPFTNESTVVTDLILDSNNLTGIIPNEIGHLVSLEHISLYDNMIRSPLPEKISNLDVTLNYIELGQNQFNETIPIWMNNMMNLTYIGLSKNTFFGTIPFTMLRTLTSLIGIDLSYNHLTADTNIFDDFSCPVDLEYIYMNHNQFNYSMHDGSFSYCEKLIEIHLHNNNITGIFPEHFYSKFKYIDISYNNLNGTIMNVSTNDDSLPIEYLSLSNNNLTGTIPNSILYLNQLLYLDLSYNQLSGSLDNVFNNSKNDMNDINLMNSIESLFLFHNPFDIGPIPQLLMNATNLRELSLSDTNRIGFIPSEIGTSLRNLTYLDLHNNQLNGSIPISFNDFQKIEEIFLNNNQFTGVLPTSFGTAIDTSNNNQLILKSFFINKNSITGTVDTMCGNETKTTIKTFIIADCYEPEPEIHCSCCALCCNDDMEECN